VETTYSERLGHPPNPTCSGSTPQPTPPCYAPDPACGGANQQPPPTQQPPAQNPPTAPLTNQQCANLNSYENSAEVLAGAAFLLGAEPVSLGFELVAIGYRVEATAGGCSSN